MRYLFYKIGLWIRDSARSSYGRPVFITAVLSSLFMAVFKLLESRLFRQISLQESRLTSVILSGLLTALIAYVALRLYRQMAQETIDELTERLRLSEELLGERNLIKALMETAPDRIYFKDLDGRFIRASASVAGDVGLLAAGDIIGRRAQDFYAESYARLIHEDEQEVMRSGQPVVGRTYREARLDGRETWASITLAPLRDRHGHIIGTLGVARDITEMRLKEQRFRQMSRALEQSPNMVVITDRHGTIEYVNPTFTALTGYLSDEIMGQNPRLLNSGRNDPAVFRTMWQTILSGREWRGELMNRRKNGDLFWARLAISPLREEDGEVAHFVGVMEDVTREKEAAAAFEAESARRHELERIVTISPAVIFLWRAAPSWPVEYVSDNVRRWGYTADELMSGKVSYASLILPEDGSRVAAEVESYTREGRSEFVQEYRILDRSGGIHWLEDRTWVRRDAEGRVTHYQGVVMDITERKRAEADLQESEHNLAEAQHIAHLGNWALEWPSRRMQWSDEMFHIAGWAEGREAPTLEGYLQTLHAEDQPALQRAIEEAIAQSRPFELEVRHRRTDGDWNHAHVRGQPVRRDGRVVRLFGTLLDISDRKRAEQAQQGLIEGLRMVLQLADELIACPGEDALYLRAVELARQRLGLERCGILILRDGEICGTYGTDLEGRTTDEHTLRVAINDIWRERMRVRDAQSSRWTLAEEPYRVWRDGRSQLLQTGWIGITPIQSSQQVPIGVFCNDTAISGAPPDAIKQEVLAVYCSLLGNMVARKRGEEEQALTLQRQRDMLERTDRLNSLGLLAAGMAHEINNPLQGMVSHLHAVQRELPPTFPARNSLLMVERGIDTIAMLVRKLLSLGTTDQNLEVANAREAIEFVTQLLDSQLRRARIRLARDAGGGDVIVAIPRHDLIQVLMNLIINARDAMPSGGTLTLGCQTAREMAVITIADTGVGMPPEVLSRIFIPFYTTKGNKGTGLGVPVADSLMRACGGEIQVKSKPGDGTTFTLRIPLARKERA